ncbi:Mitochondrial ornithine transporter 1 [Trichinella zimbabwensis]|uniref:Mitochondrial ornithine transporter 1 n=1 Tax=Trichinella zimbabwensis TaxID=268475 RepID=A0A0V1I344_9BILA|nr:Mitochondrial ornithine transporter 1 [Trichinella zimbabwensis]
MPAILCSFILRCFFVNLSINCFVFPVVCYLLLSMASESAVEVEILRDLQPKSVGLRHIVDGLVDFLAGTAGGIAAVYSGQPLDTVKVKMQSYPNLYRSSVGCLLKTFQQDQLRGLYAGTVPALVANVAENSVLFAAYGACQKAVAALVDKPERGQLNPLENACAGSLAAVFASLVLCPTELVKCRLQAMRETSGLVDGSRMTSIGPTLLTRQIVREEGIVGLFKGLSPTLIREIPGYFFFFGTYEASRHMLTPENGDKNNLGVTRTCICGGLAGIAFWLSIFPADVIKSKIQVQGHGSFYRMFLTILQTSGVRGLYAGLAPALVRTSIASGALFVAYEAVQKKLLNFYECCDVGNLVFFFWCCSKMLSIKFWIVVFDVILKLFNWTITSVPTVHALLSNMNNNNNNSKATFQLVLLQRLTHFDSTINQTWYQSFTVCDLHHQKGGAVVVYIQSHDSPTVPSCTYSGLLSEISKQLNAVVVTFVPRFFDVNKPTGSASVDNLKYLSIEEVLADLAHLVHSLRSKYPDSGKTVLVGAAHAGNLAIWFRLKYPHLCDGAIASGAPLQTTLGFDQVVDSIFERLNNIRPNCARALQDAFAQLAFLFQERNFPRIKLHFKFCTKKLPEKYALFQQLVEALFIHDVIIYDDAELIQRICTVMTNDELSSPLQRLATLIKSKCLWSTGGEIADQFKETNWSNLNILQDGRQWIYLQCTEYGKFYTVSEKISSLSEALFKQHYLDVFCKNVFQLSDEMVLKNIARSNLEYGGQFVEIDNVFFIYSNSDPRKWLGKNDFINPSSTTTALGRMLYGLHPFEEFYHALQKPQLMRLLEEINQAVRRCRPFVGVMAENLFKNIRKETVRAKEKLLESFGKADRTVDEVFDENASNFFKQQKNAERLQRELRNYITCMKALAQASRGYYEAVREVYDPEWTGSDHVRAISHSIELLWDEFCEKLIDQALNPLNSYCSQFVDLKGKIAKRGRKLVDYDSARHSYESVVGNGKKPDDVKVQKAQQELAVAKKLYDDINSELSEELPVLYDGRYTFFINNLQSMFSAESNFHCDSAKLLTEIRDVITPKFNVSHSLNHTDELSSRSSLLNRSTTPAAEVNNEDASLTSDDSKVLPNSPAVKKTTTLKNNGEAVKASSTTVQDVLYKVRASHRYTAEDTDELSFEAGEVISVVPYENPEDQDEGWLMGVLEATGQRGVFPVNFTKPL